MEQAQNTQQNRTYKRQDRSVSPETASKISSSLKSYNATHPRDDNWCKLISAGLQKYWSQIPPAPQSEGGEVTDGSWGNVMEDTENGDCY